MCDESRRGSATRSYSATFENIALGVRDARYAQFDINRVLERLLLKGSIVVKKAYCDWERYLGVQVPGCIRRASS